MAKNAQNKLGRAQKSQATADAALAALHQERHKLDDTIAAAEEIAKQKAERVQALQKELEELRSQAMPTPPVQIDLPAADLVNDMQSVMLLVARLLAGELSEEQKHAYTEELRTAVGPMQEKIAAVQQPRSRASSIDDTPTGIHDMVDATPADTLAIGLLPAEPGLLSTAVVLHDGRAPAGNAKVRKKYQELLDEIPVGQRDPDSIAAFLKLHAGDMESDPFNCRDVRQKF